MTSLQECKDIIRDYFTNSSFEINDENALDDAARELRDLCDEQGCRPVEVDDTDFICVIEKYDI